MGKNYQVGEQTRNRILQVSKELFYEKGVEKTVYDDICERAKVNRALIPYYFKNKSDLALAAYNSLMESYVQTRGPIREGYSDPEMVLIGVLYFYRLLKDPKLARFVWYVVREQEYHERMLLGESVLYEKLQSSEEHRIPKKQWEALVRLIWGMESEITAIYADENLEAAEYTTTIMIQVIYQYLGFSKEEITKMIAKVKRLLNRYQIEVHPDLTISVEKQKFKNI